MIDLELYKIFVIVAESENITKASEILNISQPAITKQIKNLENQLGFLLFERTNKGVKLTLDGERVYNEVAKPMRELIFADNRISSLRKINIGSHNHMLNCIFGKCINQFCLQYPNVNLNLVNKETDEMIKMLEIGELDIIFSKKVDYVSEKIKYINLGFLHDILIANKNSEFVRKDLELNDLENVIIYAPRTYAQTVNRFFELMN